jgi:predicted MFS family arabinose efflux permease
MHRPAAVRFAITERWIMLGVLFLVRLAMGYQFQSVASVSSWLVNDLGFSYVEVGTLIGCFLLPGVVLAVPSGLVTRMVRDKVLLMSGALTMMVGGLMMASADSHQALFAGRLVTGVGGTLFNVILTKMVTDWFAGKEIVTALAVMLTAWPIGISLGLLTQGSIAEAYGWRWAFHATAALALASFVLTLVLYRDALVPGSSAGEPLRLWLPVRQFVHVGVASAGWGLFNVSLIILVSFAPDALISQGYTPPAARSVVSLAMWATLVSIPLGGRVLEKFGWVTVSIFATLAVSSTLMVGIAQGIMPQALCIAFGLIAGIPAGALVALSAEAVTPDNRGPGLGIFYTGYYIGMTVGPAVAGWTRDAAASTAAPVLLGAGMLVMVALCVAALRLLQALWPIRV